MQPTTILQRAYRKFPLTTKDVKKGFYKGNRTGAMGRHTKYGGYIVDYSKVRTYVCPPAVRDGTYKELTPFVTRRMHPTRGRYIGATQGGPADPNLYLERWKAENGMD